MESKKFAIILDALYLPTKYVDMVLATLSLWILYLCNDQQAKHNGSGGEHVIVYDPTG